MAIIKVAVTQVARGSPAKSVAPEGVDVKVYVRAYMGITRRQIKLLGEEKPDGKAFTPFEKQVFLEVAAKRFVKRDGSKVYYKLPAASLAEVGKDLERAGLLTAAEAKKLRFGFYGFYVEGEQKQKQK